MGQPNTFDVIRSLHIIAHQTDEIFDSLLRTEFGLTLARFRVLMPLIELGQVTQAEVARFHFITEASAARQVRLLMKEGYLKRVPDPRDGRKFILTLTSKSTALLPNVHRRLGEVLGEVYASVQSSEIASLKATLAKIQLLGSAFTKDRFLVAA
jgi:DNA-binding MarR family transcriptional regulator